MESQLDFLYAPDLYASPGVRFAKRGAFSNGVEAKGS